MLISKMPDGGPEIYMAVQGEGATMGKPMVFVRCAMCNLFCNFCDTSYTWQFEGSKFPIAHKYAKPVKKDEYVRGMSIDEVVQAILKVSEKSFAVNFTGGEPTLQQKHTFEVMDKIVDETQNTNWHFEIETNGTFVISEELGSRLSQLNCSPKLASSGNDSRRDNEKAIERILDLDVPKCFKFVVVQEQWEQDYAEIQAWEEKYNVPRELIYLMPEGITRERIQESTKFVNDIASKDGYQVSTRLQILTYGDKRAV